jgi:hypothetical protein
MREAMSIRIVPSERGDRVVIHPAQGGSGGDQRRQKRNADQNSPAEDAGAAEQAPKASINGHVDKLV